MWRAQAVKETGANVRYYSIIYEAIDDVKALMRGLLAPEIKEQIMGIAQVREVFRSSKFGVVAGCLVTEGTVKRNNPIRVLRDNVVIFEGQLESLRRFKDEASEVRAGTECGIGVKNYQDVRPGDQTNAIRGLKWHAHPGCIAMAERGSSNSRTQRIESQMQRVLASLLSREVKDPRVGPLTVTQVTLAADMSEALVYIVPFGDAGAHPDLIAGLQAASGFLRGEVGRRVGRLRRA
jgi:ribosome-binding factor A